MTGGLQFDEDIRKALEMAYLTPDIMAVRNEVLKSLELRVGEQVLDIGSGPGLLAQDLAKCVGKTGRVHGIDLAENMVESARTRCAEQPWTEFQVADAMSLPFPDGTFDVVVSTQVYEYVPDLEGALAELRRVLRPNGRGLIVDTDWATPYWSASDASRRDRIIAAWGEHCAQEAVPMRLPRTLRKVGLLVQRRGVLPLLNPEYHENTFSYWLAKIIGAFVVGRKDLTSEDVDDWLADLEVLGEEGAYFFCINRYLFQVIKPGPK